MDNKRLAAIAEAFFANNPDLKVIYGTEQGHFFYERGSRDQYCNRNLKDKPVDFFRTDKDKTNSIELPVKMPGIKVLLENGLKSIADIEAHPDLTMINGIGKAKAKEIKDFIKTLK